jgi:hypothetical protein
MGLNLFNPIGFVDENFFESVLLGKAKLGWEGRLNYNNGWGNCKEKRFQTGA